jgi:murein DD-endopeptidase MepM/ murein hydrolase activator NlpD
VSCCPAVPVIVVGAAGDLPSGIQDQPMLKGESTECYTASANNPTGKHDDATGNVPDKIDTPTISLDKNAKVDETFRLQAGSTRVPTSWTLVDASTGAVFSAAGVVFNASTGTLVGTFTQADFKKKFKLLLTALDSTGEIDSRSYVFSPDIANIGSDSIQLQHPLPGAVVTSRFDPNRFHPVLKIIKPHNGCDFALPGHRTSDVLSAADGEVIFTGFEDRGAGNYIKIKHTNSSGKHLCTTVYMHLAKIYVSKGDKVFGGSKIGYEGNTGIGTGAHLHFEVRLPNDARVNPEPYITGSLKVARETNEDNTAVESSIETKNGTAVITPSNVDAKISGCTQYGSDYPVQVSPVQAPLPSPSGNIFDYAWDLTMKTEVIAWGSTPPTSSETLAGLIETKDQQRKCGYVDHPSDPGGVTKFGIAQKFNKGIDVKSMEYSVSRDSGYSEFWNNKISGNMAGTKPKSAVAIFNISFLCGLGGAASILESSNISSLDDVSSVDALCDALKNYLHQKTISSPSKKVFERGWFARVETIRSYCKAIS